MDLEITRRLQMVLAGMERIDRILERLESNAVVLVEARDQCLASMNRLDTIIQELK